MSGTEETTGAVPVAVPRPLSRLERERYGRASEVEREVHGSWLDADRERHGTADAAARERYRPRARPA